MSQLNVHLRYDVSSRSPWRRPEAPLALPVRVMDAEGSEVVRGVTSERAPATFNISPQHTNVFVRLTWPSGKTQTQRVSLMPTPVDVTFADTAFASREWSAWAVPRVSSAVLAPTGAQQAPGIDAFDDVWLALWSFTAGQWTVDPILPMARYSNPVAKQIDVKLSPGAYLLEVAGMELATRFVSLPADGPCRVLLTPNTSHDPRADRLKVVVTSFRPDAEALLEFLSRDALDASEAVATQLLAGKMDDPVSAVAGAYYLLRSGGWQSRPVPYWLDNLNTRFTWLPDGAIIRCVSLIREGLREAAVATQARRLFVECLDRGLPVYAEGLALLREAASVLQALSEPGGPAFEAAVRKTEQLAIASAWAGMAFSFYGRAPDEPALRRRDESPAIPPPTALYLRDIVDF